MKLYITGATVQSQKALANIKKICKSYLEDSHELVVIDVYQNPALTKDDQVIAIPTLIKKLPTPTKRFIGDLSDLHKVVSGLDLKKNLKKNK